MRYLAAAALAMLFVSTAFSQGRFGIKAGPVVNYVQTKGTGGDFSDIKAGYTFGFTYSLPVNAHFQVQPEFNYIALQTEESITATTFHLNYYQVPVLLKLVTNKGDLSVVAGPQLGILAHASKKSGNTKSDATAMVTETDFSALAGLEYVTPINITLSARFTQGFSNVFKVEFDTYKSRHQYLTLTVGYLFGKKKS